MSTNAVLVKKKRIEKVKFLYPFSCLLGYTALSQVPVAVAFLFSLWPSPATIIVRQTVPTKSDWREECDFCLQNSLF